MRGSVTATVAVAVLALCVSIAAAKSCKPNSKWSDYGPDGWYPGAPNGGLGSPYTADIDTNDNYNIETLLPGFPITVGFDAHEVVEDTGYCVQACTPLPCKYWTTDNSLTAERKKLWVPACGKKSKKEKYLKCLQKNKGRSWCADCSDELEAATGGKIADLVGDDYDDGKFHSRPTGWYLLPYSTEVYETAARKISEREGIPFTDALALVKSSQHSGRSKDARGDEVSILGRTTSRASSESVANDWSEIESSYAKMIKDDDLVLTLDPDTTTSFLTILNKQTILIESRFILCREESSTACVLAFAINDEVQSSSAEFMLLESCNVAEQDSFEQDSQQLSYIFRTKKLVGVFNVHLAYICEGSDVQIKPYPGSDSPEITVSVV